MDIFIFSYLGNCFHQDELSVSSVQVPKPVCCWIHLLRTCLLFHRPDSHCRATPLCNSLCANFPSRSLYSFLNFFNLLLIWWTVQSYPAAAISHSMCSKCQLCSRRPLQCFVFFSSKDNQTARGSWSPPGTTAAYSPSLSFVYGFWLQPAPTLPWRRRGNSL